MPQIFQVLRCYKCTVFQVHQTRKDNKWVCKLCGEKQSIKRHYGIGTAKDCRLHVQKLNNMRGEKEETIKTYISDGSDYDETIVDNTENTNRMSSIEQSKWSAYVDEPENKDANTPEYLNNVEVVLEVPQKRKTSSSYSKQIKYAKKFPASVNCININSDNFELAEDEISYTVKMNKKSQLKNISTGTLNSKTLNTIENLNSQERQPCSLHSSKWHQYLEEDTNKTSGEFSKNCSIKDSFFSLTDDNDIDKILDL